MTFIAVVTSPRFVFVSSDLRVTAMKGGIITEQSDWAMKTTLMGSDEVFGFTGLARLGRQLTDEWLGEALAGVAPGRRLQALAEAATSSFKDLNLRIPHAFIGAGFHSQKNRRIPHAWIVTNSWDDVELRYDPRLLDSRFEVYSLPMDKSRTTNLWSVGGEDENGEVSHPAIQKAKDDLERIVRSDCGNPRLAMDRLAQLNQEMTALGKHIGASAVVTSLPRNASQNSGIVVWVEEPNLQAMNRFAVSVNYVADYQGTHPERWRQPGLISEQGFSMAGVVFAREPTGIGPDPRRHNTGAAFGIKSD
ncbi:hypothetical protein [Pedococcus bigeumensis]|uniref:hypothetical protein n=1 Tax=Pedococcus bigeumensis TaxID=433644 RepID=UPI002FED317F